VETVVPNDTAWIVSSPHADCCAIVRRPSTTSAPSDSHSPWLETAPVAPAACMSLALHALRVISTRKRAGVQLIPSGFFPGRDSRSFASARV
jgi:hypothetical protein